MRPTATMISAVGLLSICGCRTAENTRHLEGITAFKNDPRVVGRWISIDFVTNIDDFKPEFKSFKADLYLKEFVFQPNGKTHKPFWTWTKGRVYQSGDNTTARYIIKRIGGEDYLFLEWMSGDVTIRGMKPKYYVLRREKQTVARQVAPADASSGCDLALADFSKTDGPPDRACGRVS